MKTAATLAPARTRFENILYATDFSDAATHAIPFVNKFAKHFQSNVLALYVRPPAVNPMTQPSSWPFEIDTAQAIDQKHREELLNSFPEINTEVVIEEGELQSLLTAEIEKQKTDLVIIGTRGRTGIAKLFLGSVAEQIFRTVPCPVMTVGPNSQPAKAEIREILFATDFGPESEAAAAYAISLAQEFQARLIMLHVVPEPKRGELDGWPNVFESSKKLLARLVPPEAEAWCKPEFFVERGDPAERILDLAHLREVDLVVLGAQAESGVPGAATHLPIATAHKVVARAICPVLTYRGN